MKLRKNNINSISIYYDTLKKKISVNRKINPINHRYRQIIHKILIFNKLSMYVCFSGNIFIHYLPVIYMHITLCNE